MCFESRGNRADTAGDRHRLNNVPAWVTPPGAGHTYMRGVTCPIVPTRPDSESTVGFPRAALPDDPNAETRLARPDGGDDPLPPDSAALFPEIPTWTDEQLIIAVELAD